MTRMPGLVLCCILLSASGSAAQDPMADFLACVRACPGDDAACMLGCRDTLTESRRAADRARVQAQRDAEAAVRATWEAPARIWRIGNLLFWTPPAGGPSPRGYRVEQGDSVLHFQPHTFHDGREVYEYILRGDAPARVEAEHGGGLNHRVYSESVAPGPEPPATVQRIRYFASRWWRSQASRDRWRRVLAGFGVPCAEKPAVCPLEPAMTAGEARGYHDRGWSPWWGHAADVLERLETTTGGAP